PPAPVRVGHAHGDDRGEFLLALAPAAIRGSELPRTIDIRVVVYGPAQVQPPDPADLPELDPWWDLPLEQVPAPGAADDVSPGRRLPDGYVAGDERQVTFVVGRALSAADDIDDFSFALPV
ncbi:MAG: hypothetical protein J5I93_03745, partial [Pirellulaceae bacterium]|nr:hypothetical protein [Pirellulaceae bacterium]